MMTLGLFGDEPQMQTKPAEEPVAKVAVDQMEPHIGEIFKEQIRSYSQSEIALFKEEETVQMPAAQERESETLHFELSLDFPETVVEKQKHLPRL